MDDHLVLRLNGNKRKVGEYFRVLVLNEEIWISDREVKKDLPHIFILLRGVNYIDNLRHFKPVFRVVPRRLSQNQKT